MKYYTYENPNSEHGRTDWGGGLAGEQLERLARAGALEMRADVDEAGNPLQTGHARARTDETVIHLNFTEVDAAGADGADWWEE